LSHDAQLLYNCYVMVGGTTKINITTKLIADEARKRGYTLDIFKKSSATVDDSSVICAKKGGRNIWFKSLYTALTPSTARYIATSSAHHLRDTSGCFTL